MTREAMQGGIKERLDDFIKQALSGKTVQLQIKVYKNLIKQLSRSESTDDINIETDMCMLMADFIPNQIAQGMPSMVSKVYAICPINECEIDDKTTRRIANERLRMDYTRLREARVKFEEKYF